MHKGKKHKSIMEGYNDFARSEGAEAKKYVDSVRTNDPFGKGVDDMMDEESRRRENGYYVKGTVISKGKKVDTPDNGKGPSRNSRETDSINAVNAFSKMKNDYMSRKFKGNDERLGPITPEQNQKEFDREKHEFYYNTTENKMKMIPTDDGEQRIPSFMNKLESYQLAPERKSALNMLGISRKQSPLNFKGANSSNSSCWDGYKKVGTKPSPSGTGETVNDCVKK